MAVAGFSISGGVPTIIFGGFILTLLFMFVKPILSIITFPLNLITLGLFSWIVNIFILYLLTVFLPAIAIRAFTYPGMTFAGFVIPRMHISVFFAFLVSALIIYLITAVLSWLTR
jgi:uncharacterized membrane protein YvlD (DUF360 family)